MRYKLTRNQRKALQKLYDDKHSMTGTLMLAGDGRSRPSTVRMLLALADRGFCDRLWQDVYYWRITKDGIRALEHK